MAAIDAVLRVGERRFGRTERRRKKGADAVDELHRTPERRRAAFWRATERLGSHRMLSGGAVLRPFQMEYLGWPPGLVLEDIDWLLADGPTRDRGTERRLAMYAALEVWARADQPGPLKARIAAVAATDAEMQTAYAEWMEPRVKSADEIRSEEELAEVRRTNVSARAEQEQSWVKFVADMRANPDQLRRPRPTTATTVDGRLYDLWQLLNQAAGRNSRYAIDSVAPLAEIVGQEAAAAFAEGLAEVWRAWKPTLRSACEPSARNQIGTIDRVGIAGVSIEAASRADWASRLTEEQATRAAEYATLEINGFPVWIAALAAAWPTAVEKVLAREAASDLDNPTPGTRYQALEDMDRADDRIARLMAPAFWRELKARRDLNPLALRPMLTILGGALPEESRQELYDLALDRFRSAADPEVSAMYLGAAYALDGKGATDALTAKLALLGDAERKVLVERVLPEIFGSRRRRRLSASLDVATLERLVLLAYRAVRVEDDHDRANGGVYSPDERDAAQDARSAAFKMLVSTPGRDTFDAILRFIEAADFPVPASRLRALALERAGEDAESIVWAADEPLRFEQRFERPPATGKDLQLVALQRLDDLQHDLIHGDFQQGTTLSALPDEQAVQNWMADRLRQAQGSAYSIEREVHVAGEKEPDLRFRAKASDANVATEIKVASRWTLEQLEDALVKQLCGQYLRANDGRDGILLLVHQAPRPKGWELPDGTYLNFEAVVQRLRELAASIRRRSSAGPQPEVCVIDVSSCARFAERSKPARRKSSKPKTAA